VIKTSDLPFLNPGESAILVKTKYFISVLWLLLIYYRFRKTLPSKYSQGNCRFRV